MIICLFFTNRNSIICRRQLVFKKYKAHEFLPSNRSVTLRPSIVRIHKSDLDLLRDNWSADSHRSCFREYPHDGRGQSNGVGLASTNVSLVVLLEAGNYAQVSLTLRTVVFCLAPQYPPVIVHGVPAVIAPQRRPCAHHRTMARPRPSLCKSKV